MPDREDFPMQSSSMDTPYRSRVDDIFSEEIIDEEQYFPVQQSNSSESQFAYGTENVVRELKPEYVRWFYKTEGDKKGWIPFTGSDSLQIETRFRENSGIANDASERRSSASVNSRRNSNPFSGSNTRNGSTSSSSKSRETNPSSPQHVQEIIVRGGLYEVNLQNWTCSAAYWPGKIN